MQNTQTLLNTPAPQYLTQKSHPRAPQFPLEFEGGFGSSNSFSDYMELRLVPTSQQAPNGSLPLRGEYRICQETPLCFDYEESRILFPVAAFNKRIGGF